jgi:class 3 adenylate cyclase/tetratricopeptide (TPR) repeat protein
MVCPSCGAPSRPGVKFCEECGARLEIICPSCGAHVPPDKKFCGECGARLAPLAVSDSGLASRPASESAAGPARLEAAPPGAARLETPAAAARLETPRGAAELAPPPDTAALATPPGAAGPATPGAGGPATPPGAARPAIPPHPARQQTITADDRFATPSGYTPAHLAERILKDRAALRGERKQVTVLFADVSGFTAISERLDPEEVHDLMNQAFERMLAEIHRYEGTVNQFLGDGLMALFGAPVAHEDHARRAALAALGMQRMLGAYRDSLQRTRDIDFRVRIGLNTGLVVVGAIGDNLRMDYTAVGDTTNVAARMQQVAEPGQIVLAEPTRRLIADHFELRSLGSITLKNRAEPMAAWALVAAKRSEAQRPLGPMLGRDDALAVLTHAFAAVRSGRGQVVYVLGDAGLGKSRLLLELRRQVTGEATWLEGRCLSFGQGTAFLPLVGALRQHFDIDDADGDGDVVAKIERGLQPLGARAAESAPYVRYLLSADPGDVAVMKMDPTERRGRIFQALQRLVLLVGRERPVVLAIEDLHWVDGASEAYLKALIDGIAGARVLLVLTYRPTYTAPFGEHTYVSRLVLEPLDDPDARRLVQATLGVDELPEELIRVVARKAEGNPFFLEELGRALVETGAMRKSNGHVTLVRPASTIVVPDRVQDVIAARIDRLADEQKQTVQVASVIGREFALRLLQRVADATERLEGALAQLKSLEFIYERLAPADVEYVFKHALTQDVAYESILHARRRVLHARIGEAIEELYADRLDERAEELAHHFLRGDAWAKAAYYARLAGDRAAALCVDDKAVDFYERALEALGRVPATPDIGSLGIDVRLALRAPLWRAGRLERLIEIFRDAEALAKQYGETQRLDVVYSFFAQYYWAKGDQEQAIAYGRRCLEIAESRNDLGSRVTGLFYLGHAYHALGRFPEALEQVTTLIDTLEGPRATERFGLSGLPYCGACALGAECLTELGDETRALDLLRRGERIAEATNHLYSKMPLAAARGWLLLHQGAVTDAIAILEPAVAVCREKRFAGQLMRTLTALGQAYSAVGRAGEAVPLLREAIGLQEKAGAFVNRSLWVRALAEAYFRADQIDQAEATAQEALGFAERHHERGYEAWARWLLGEIDLRRGDQAAAVRQIERARSIAAELGMRPLAEQCQQTLTRAA